MGILAEWAGDTVGDPGVATPPGPFERWAGKLRLSILDGPITSALACVIGDKAISWAKQAQAEHYPELSTDLASIALLSHERQLEQGPGESTASFASRLTYAVQQNQLRGTAMGMLDQLYWLGFTGAIIVQQNGLAHTLSGVPDVSDPTATHVATKLSARPSDGHPWWRFDSVDAHCSRFAVLFDLAAGGIDPVLTTPDNLSRLQRTIAVWKPAKATCVGIYVCRVGRFIGWPLRNVSSTGTVGPSTVDAYSAT